MKSCLTGRCSETRVCVRPGFGLAAVICTVTASQSKSSQTEWNAEERKKPPRWRFEGRSDSVTRQRRLHFNRRSAPVVPTRLFYDCLEVETFHFSIHKFMEITVLPSRFTTAASVLFSQNIYYLQGKKQSCCYICSVSYRSVSVSVSCICSHFDPQQQVELHHVRTLILKQKNSFSAIHI